MNWSQLIADMRTKGVTLDEIASQCGFSSRGHVHDVWKGRQARVLWEIGDKLLRLHKRVMRRKA